jgi:hypothetical protein
MENNELANKTEEELLVFFKEKYNLIEAPAKTDVKPEQDLQKTEDPNAPKAVAVGNKVTTGFSGLFDGTSWGKR